MDNIDYQAIQSDFSSIDPALAMTQGGVSDTTAMVNNAVANYTPMEGSEPLSEALKRISQVAIPNNEVPEFNAGGFGGFGGQGFSLNTANPATIGQQLVQGNMKESPWETIDLDRYYNKMSDSWDSMDQSKGGLVGIGGGVVAGAATGALVAGPWGALVGGLLGGVEGYQTSKNIGYGYVRNKEGINEDAAYNQQGFWGRAGAGLMKFTHAANAMTVGTVATLYGMPKAISEGSMKAMFNNDLAKFVDDWDKSSESSNRIYHSNAYTNSSALGQVLHSEFLFDVLAPGAGFMVGAIGAGKGAGLAMRGLGFTNAASGATTAALRNIGSQAFATGGKSLLQKQLLKTFGQAVWKDVAATNIKSLATNFTTLATSAAPESAMEARGAMNESREAYVQSFRNMFGRAPSIDEMKDFEAANVKAGNGVFLANLGVVGMSNWLQFGKTLGLGRAVETGLLESITNRAFGLGIRRTAAGATEMGVERAIWNAASRSRAQAIGHKVFAALEAPVTEGLWEEGIQSVISGTHRDYLQSRFDPTATERNKTLIQSFGDSLAHTYTSKEGWTEIMAGMIIGAGGSFMGDGGFLGQRGVKNTLAQQERSVDELNRTQAEFESSQDNFLRSQIAFNLINNSKASGTQDRIASMNQQLVNYDKAEAALAEGNLAQAQYSYRNALFAKLAAEKRAGISDNTKYDMQQMVQNVPSETLSELGFTTEAQQQEFRDTTLKNIEGLTESFDIAYKVAEQLNITAPKSSPYSSAQLTEQAALHLFHGIHAAQDANSIARSIEDIVGTTGVASAMNYYANLEGKNLERVKQQQEKQKQVKQLESKRSDLLTQYSTAMQKATRETENTAVTQEADRLNAEIQEIDAQLEGLNSQISTLSQILNDRANIPTLPLGNPAQQFLDRQGIQLADINVDSVLESLNSLETYMDHLADPTGKSEEELHVDQNKAEVLGQLLDMYKSQMAVMRNFAKTSQMLGDPAYMNHINRSIFNKGRKETDFNIEDWIKNNTSGFTELSQEDLDKLEQAVEGGLISPYDLHTYITNSELMLMDNNINRPSTQSVEEEVAQDTEVTDEPTTTETEIEEKLKRRRRLAEIRDKKIEEALDNFASKFDISKLIENTRFGDQSEQNFKPQNTYVDVRDLVPGDKFMLLGKEVEVESISMDVLEIKIIGIDGTTYTLENVPEDIKIEKVSQQKQKPEQTSEENIKTFEDYEAMVQNEIDRINAQYTEAVTEVEDPQTSIGKKLQEINDVIEEILKDDQSKGGTVSREAVDRFHEERDRLSKLIKRYDTLLKKPNKTPNDIEELNSISNEINTFGAIEGRVSDINGSKIRLSDLLEQRTQLENELFNDNPERLEILPEEVQREVTTISTTEEDGDPDFKTRSPQGDASVLNSYHFATFNELSDGTVQVSNLTPEGLVSHINVEGNPVSAVTPTGDTFILEGNWDRQVNPGDVINFELDGQLITINIDESRRPHISKVTMDIINEKTPLNFDKANRIGQSTYSVVTINNGENTTYLPSNFDVVLDDRAIEKMEPGDQVRFMVDEDSDYNKALIEEYNRLHPKMDPMVEDIVTEAKELLKEFTSATAARKREIKERLNELFPGLDGKIPSFRSTVKEMENFYKPVGSQADRDNIRKKLRDNILIVAINSKGERVGVLKGLGNSSSKVYMTRLRTAVFEQFEKDGLKAAPSKFALPVTVVFSGIPNTKSNADGKIWYTFSEEDGDTTINPSEIKTVGYATYGKIVLANGKKVSTPYNYARQIVNGTEYANRRVPVVVFNYNGKEVVYPISLAEKEGDSLAEQLDNILAKEGKVPLTDLIGEVNEFMASNGFSKDLRLTSLGFAQSKQEIVEAVGMVPNITTIDELMKGDFREVLRNFGRIDINITDAPFIGPKIKFDIKATPEIKSSLVEEKTVNIPPAVAKEAVQAEENNSCLE